MVVNGTVEDSLTVRDPGQYGGPEGFEEKLEVPATNATNGTPVEFRVNGAPATRTDPSTVEWESGDVQQVDIRAGSLDPIYEFAVEDTDASVTRGDAAEITVSVENTGNAGTDDLTITAAGEDTPRVSRTLDLEPNESSTEVLSVPTRETDGAALDLTIATADTSRTEPVTLLSPSNFTVTLDPDVPAEGDRYDPDTDDLNGTVSVENVGETTDEQNVSVSFGDETLVDQAVSLNGSESTTLEFNRTLTAADAGRTQLTAATDDDIATQSLSVIRPGTFAVDVIDAESTLNPVAGQNITIVAEVTNIGESEVTRSVNLTNVTDGARTEEATEGFTLGSDESQDFVASVSTSDSDADKNLVYEVAAGADDSERVDVSVEDRDAFLDVSIDSLNKSDIDEPGAGTTPVRVDTTVENLGTSSASGTIRFTANGEEFATKSFDDSDGTQIFNVTYPVELGDAPEVTFEAIAERDDVVDSTDEESLSVTSQAEFAVSIESPTNVTDGLSDEEFAPTIAVENVGGQNASGTVTVFFNGTQQNTTEFSIDSGESSTIIEPNDGFAINASNFTGGQNYLLEAEVTNDATGQADAADTELVSIGEVANFTVDSVTAPSSADPGEQITIDATVKNTGGVTEEKPVSIEFGDTTLQTTVENVSNDSTVDLSATYTPTTADAGTTEVSVSTPDDEATATTDVRENARFVTDLTVDETAIAGDTVTAAVTVENVGGNASNTTDVRLLADGDEVDNTTDLTLARDEQTTETFQLSPETAGSLTVQGVTDDSVADATVDVGEPGALDLSVRSITDPVTTDENITAVVAAENVGDGDLTDRRIRLSIDGTLVNTTAVNVAGGSTETVELTGELSRTVPEGETETASVAVFTPEDRIDRDVTVEPVPDDPFFRVDSLEVSSDEVLNESGTTVQVNATVTNIGDLEGSQDIEFSAGNDVSETNESLTVDNGSAVDVSFRFDVADLGLTLAEDESTVVAYEIGTANQTERGTLSVVEPDPPTPELTQVAVDETATQEEPLAATVTVTNVGDQALDGNETVTLDYEDGSVVNDSVAINSSEAVSEGESLSPGQQATVDLAVQPPTEPLAGSFDRQVTVGFGSEAFAGDTVTRTVRVDFEGVASGVAAAEADDTEATVRVRPGQYLPRRTIDVGDGITAIESTSTVGSPVIEQPSGDDDTAMRIESDGVTIEGVTLDGDGNGTGLEIAATDTSLEDVRVVNWATGIDETAGTNTLSGVDLVDTQVGVRLAGDNGTSVDFPRVVNASDTGILVESAENTILGAEVLRSATGIELLGPDNEIRESTVRNSPEYGIRVTEVSGNLEDNPSAIINASLLESNGVSVFSDGSDVEATDNWWGTPIPRENVDYVARSSIDAGDPAQTRPESNFAVTDGGIPGDVLRGDTFSIDATIENDGTKSDLQRIELKRGDGTVVDSQTVSLNASESATVTLSDSTSAADGESISLTVASLDDESTDASIAVDDPAAFSLGALSDPRSEPLGNDITIDVPIGNTGDREGTVTTRLTAPDGDVVATTETTVSGGETQTASVTWPTDVQGTDTVTVELLDETDTVIASATRSVTVTPPALDTSVLSIADTNLVVGDTTELTVSEELTDGTTNAVTDDADTTITSSDPSIVSVDGASLSAESTGTADITAAYTRDGTTETDSASVTVTAADDGEEEDPAPTGGGGGGGSILGPDTGSSLELEATTTESVTPDLDVEANQRVATTESVEGVESIAFDTTDRIGEVTVADVDPTTADVNPPGGTVTVQEISVPDDVSDQSATIAFSVSTDRLESVGAPTDALSVVRLTEDGWQSLDTRVAERTDAAVTLEAETPGFSVFAVNAVGEPEAAATVDPATATTGESITLDGSDSSAPYGEIVSYEWSVADQTLSGETPTVTLEESGDYTVELTVTTDAGETDSTTVSVTTEQPAQETQEQEPAEAVTDDGIPGFGALGALVVLVLLSVAAIVRARNSE